MNAHMFMNHTMTAESDTLMTDSDGQIYAKELGFSQAYKNVTRMVCIYFVEYGASLYGKRGGGSMGVGHWFSLPTYSTVHLKPC